MHSVEFSILWPAFIAGLLVTATHVPLGMQVLRKGIVFIDLAIAQIAGLGVIAADAFGFEGSAVVQISALAAALLGALLLTWTDKKFPEVQEAIIGVTFILAATGAVMLLASNPHGAEHMKDILVGQILWVDATRLPLVGLIYAAILGILFGLSAKIGRVGFYLLFACAVTVSVQLVGLYLVFTTLILPALVTRRYATKQLPRAYVLGGAGYALGLWLSAWLDLPSGAVIVWAMAALGILVHAFSPKTASA